MSACETQGMPLSRFSMFCGETFFPPAVTRMSFLRSVTVRNPSSSMTPTSPVWSQPSPGRADRAELEAIRTIDVGRGRLLCLAVALEDQDVERVEELGDLLRERCAARDRRAEPSAEPRLDLRVDEPVRDSVPQRQPGGNRLLTLPQLADLTADVDRPVDQTPPDAS